MKYEAQIDVDYNNNKIIVSDESGWSQTIQLPPRVTAAAVCNIVRQIDAALWHVMSKVYDTNKIEEDEIELELNI